MNKKENSKVLIISHNVLSTTSNMGKTMLAFFNNWEPENIAQLYLHSEIPNTDICTNYFRITDFDMLNSIIQFSDPGTILNKNDIKLNKTSTRVDQGLKNKIYNFGKKKNSYMYIVRNVLWSTNKWNSEKLKKWIEDFNPEIVFFAAGDYSFSIKIALKICNEKKIPLVVYFGDEFYFLNVHKFSLANWINKKIYKNSFENMFNNLKTYITASDKMLLNYKKEFKKDGHAIMTSTNLNQNSISSNKIDVIKISYIGNLGLNRWKALIEIGNCLKDFNILLNVYSAESRVNILANMKIENGISFHGAIPFDEVKEVINESTILIHVESMDKESRQRTKFSMSTKIAESLASGACIFAYGPKEVSSIEYLQDNKGACVVTRKEDLKTQLKNIISDEQLREYYRYNAEKLVSKRHNFVTNTNLFQEIMRN